MVRTTERSLETVSWWAVNARLNNLSGKLLGGHLAHVEYSHGQQILYQLISLGAETQLPEICDDKDVTITVLEGQGNLTLNQEIIPLESGRLIFIPAQMPHTLQTQTSLVFLLSRCESNSGLPEKAWSITL